MGASPSVAMGQSLPPCPGLLQPHTKAVNPTSPSQPGGLSWANHSTNPSVTCATTSIPPTASLGPVPVAPVGPSPWLPAEEGGELPLPTAVGSFQRSAKT